MLEIIKATEKEPPAKGADQLTIAVAQIAPCWLDKGATTQKIVTTIGEAAEAGAKLVCFGEALLPGYPFWVERTEGARFDDAAQKQFYAYYLDQAVRIERGDLEPICQAARQFKIAIYLGLMERAADRGSHSVYASLVYINGKGDICSVHRKLQPTYEERLVWAMGDGHGLVAHPLAAFTLGGLNCWENWLPLARAALYGQGVDLHISVWPGGVHNTKDIPRFIALEGRSFVVAACGLMRPQDLGHSPQAIAMTKAEELPTFIANGGSGIVAPNGEWVVGPVIGQEALLIATLDHGLVRQERHMLDVAGHYARPDITQLRVNRQRLKTMGWLDEEEQE